MTNDKREAKPGQLRDEQTKAAVEQAERAKGQRDRDERAGENPADKHRRLRGEAAAGRHGREGDEAEGREGEAPEYEPGPDGTVHIMEEEMLAAAALPDNTIEENPTMQPRVIHVMESQMKGEAVEDYLETQPGIDNTLPEEPLPGKPPEPPLGGEGRSGRQPEPVQYPTASKRR
jgi:hypothetical protein